MRAAIPVLICVLLIACSAPGKAPEGTPQTKRAEAAPPPPEPEAPAPPPLPEPEEPEPATEAREESVKEQEEESPEPPPQEEEEQEDAYWIRAELEDARDEAGRPVLRFRGTTNLPDGSLVSMSYYYDRVVVGHHFLYRGAHAKDGAFAMDFPIYKERNFPGRHIVHVAFRCMSQHADIRKAMGEHARNYERTAELTIGTEKDLEEARRQTRLRLAKEFERIDALAGEVLACFETLLKNPDFDAWTKRAQEWDRELQQILRRNVNVFEYKAVGILGTAQSRLHDLIDPLNWMFRAGGSAIQAIPPNTALLPEMQRVRGQTIRDYVRRCIEHLGVKEGLGDEVRAEVGKLASLLDSARERLRAYAEDEGRDPAAFAAAASAFRKDLLQAVFDLNEEVPSALKLYVGDLVSAGQEVARLLAEAGEAEEPSVEPLEKALAKAHQARDTLLKALADWENPPDGKE